MEMNMLENFPEELLLPLLYKSLRGRVINPFNTLDSDTLFGDRMDPAEIVQLAISLDPFYEAGDVWPSKEHFQTKFDLARDQNRPEIKMISQMTDKTKLNDVLFLYRKELTEWYIRLYNLKAEEREKSLK